MNGDKPSIDVIDKQKIVTQYLSCSPIPKRMGDFPLKSLALRSINYRHLPKKSCLLIFSFIYIEFIL